MSPELLRRARGSYGPTGVAGKWIYVGPYGPPPTPPHADHRPTIRAVRGRQVIRGMATGFRYAS
jgi:hypothetical protein